MTPGRDIRTFPKWALHVTSKVLIFWCNLVSYRIRDVAKAKKEKRKFSIFLRKKTLICCLECLACMLITMSCPVQLSYFWNKCFFFFHLVSFPSSPFSEWFCLSCFVFQFCLLKKINGNLLLGNKLCNEWWNGNGIRIFMKTVNR